MGYILDDGGGRRGIDIVFAGHFSHTPTPHLGEAFDQDGRRLPIAFASLVTTWPNEDYDNTFRTR